MNSTGTTIPYIRLSTDWNADPNAPETSVKVIGDSVVLSFYLNYFLHDQFKESDRGQLTFMNCHKYYFGGPNDEGYFRGQHRYKQEQLPFGEFYILKSDWHDDFPVNAIVINSEIRGTGLNHYIFFQKERTFECVAENFEFELRTI